MAIRKCFIINECGFRDDLIKELKEILWAHNYNPEIAEEVPTDNVELLYHKIFKPIQESDFVIVILDPKGESNRDANFNVAFEYGYAKAQKNKKIILLFNGDLRNLPTDIKGYVGMSLKTGRWKEELTSLIKEEVKKIERLRAPKEEIVKLLKNSISENGLDIFSELLREFAYDLDLLEDGRIINLVLSVFENSNANGKDKYQAYSGRGMLYLLTALNIALQKGKKEDNAVFKQAIIKYLDQIVINSDDPDILKEALKLLIKIDDEQSIKAFMDFLEKRSSPTIQSTIGSFQLDFEHYSSEEFCIKLIYALKEFKSNPDRWRGRPLGEINTIWKNVMTALAKKQNKEF